MAYSAADHAAGAHLGDAPARPACAREALATKAPAPTGVALVWPQKDSVLEGGQTKEEATRPLLFLDPARATGDVERLLAPKVLTAFRRYGPGGEQPVTALRFDESGVLTENLVIRGNNLVVLHLLRPRCAGRVKLIYIDPPYNTGRNAFRYYDDFKGSSWLTFMKNRLEAAFELLSDDGAMFVQIGDREAGYLQVLLDEISPDGFINKVCVRTRAPSGFKTINQGLFESAEYILVYGKHRSHWTYQPQYTAAPYDANYSWQVVNRTEPAEQWQVQDLRRLVAQQLGFQSAAQARRSSGNARFEAALAEYALENRDSVFRRTEINNDAGRETLELKARSLAEPGRVFVLERRERPSRYILDGHEMSFYANKVREVDGELTPSTMLTNIWTDIAWEGIASEGGVKMKRGKKPEKLLQRIIAMGSMPGDLVLDFFLGSGTTCAVAHKMGRRYIGVEQLEYGQDDAVVRLNNVIRGDPTGISRASGWQGGGDFLYCELQRYNAAYLPRIEAATSSAELASLWREIAAHSFLPWYLDPHAPHDASNEFEALAASEGGIENQRRLFADLVAQNQLYVNLTEIDHERLNISAADKELNRQFYGAAHLDGTKGDQGLGTRD